ncbi:MAG: hypothetical protein J6T10_06865 [Methanobrevibacter sp.]|nr:hypothetical protein [Methanobrevibacter sp.]
MRTTLNTEELNKRAEEVFELQEGDYIWDVEVIDGQVYVNMEEVTEKGDTVIFDYKPDMNKRPEALDYLLGLRDDFND